MRKKSDHTEFFYNSLLQLSKGTICEAVIYNDGEPFVACEKSEVSIENHYIDGVMENRLHGEISIRMENCAFDLDVDANTLMRDKLNHKESMHLLYSEASSIVEIKFLPNWYAFNWGIMRTDFEVSGIILETMRK